MPKLAQPILTQVGRSCAQKLIGHRRPRAIDIGTIFLRAFSVETLRTVEKPLHATSNDHLQLASGSSKGQSSHRLRTPAPLSPNGRLHTTEAVSKIVELYLKGDRRQADALLTALFMSRHVSNHKAAISGMAKFFSGPSALLASEHLLHISAEHPEVDDAVLTFIVALMRKLLNENDNVTTEKLRHMVLSTAKSTFLSSKLVLRMEVLAHLDRRPLQRSLEPFDCYIKENVAAALKAEGMVLIKFLRSRKSVQYFGYDVPLDSVFGKHIWRARVLLWTVARYPSLSFGDDLVTELLRAIRDHATPYVSRWYLCDSSKPAARNRDFVKLGAFYNALRKRTEARESGEVHKLLKLHRKFEMEVEAREANKRVVLAYAYSFIGDPATALTLISEIEPREAIPSKAYDMLLNGYAQVGDWDGMDGVVGLMRDRGLSLSRRTFEVCIEAHIYHGNMQKVYDLFKAMEEAGFGITQPLIRSTIDALGDLQMTDSAVNLFNNLASAGRLLPSVYIEGKLTLVSTLARRWRFDEAIGLLKEAEQEKILGLSRLGPAYHSLVTHLTAAGHKDLAEDLLARMEVLSFPLEQRLYARLAGCAYANDVDGAEEVFESLKKAKLVITEKAFIYLARVYYHDRNVVEAEGLRERANAEGVTLGSQYYSWLLRCYAAAGMPHRVHETLELLEQKGMKLFEGTFRSLTRVLCKNGQEDEAIKVLDHVARVRGGPLRRRLAGPVLEALTHKERDELAQALMERYF